MNEAATPGIAHFVSQTDAVGMVLFVILLLMSVASWTVILVRLVLRALQRRRSHQFRQQLESQASVADFVGSHPADPLEEPFSWFMAELSKAHRSADALGQRAQILMDRIAARLEGGLTLLGTVASTAPFVGLFGTVWAVYHALVAIGMTGSAGLEQVAGPVGEALIMTGLGLAVAIPAVVGYNLIVRTNRLLLTELNGFAQELIEDLVLAEEGKAQSS
jgi:biopolymer transport protein ExbB